MRRRGFLVALGLGAAAYGGWRLALAPRLWNPCLGPLPAELAEHPLVRAAWSGLDPTQVWDCHVHLGGVGDTAGGVWINPDTASLLHPVQYAQRRFYLNAACVERAHPSVDRAYVERLAALQAQLAPGARLMLLALDAYHDRRGRRIDARTTLYVPNAYAAAVVRRHRGRFEWIASVHPYRADALEALERAVAAGARAVKWLPPAMGIDPASPRCDRFYEALVRLGLPLLTHAGAEAAVGTRAEQALGNPLRLRRPLEHGVRVIVAHCASLGSAEDIDRRPRRRRSNFELFARLMEEPRYEGRLFGDLSAVVQVNRADAVLRALIERDHWHPRLVNGSDYPLPGVVPLISLTRLAARGLLAAADAPVLARIRRYNPLLFDFVLKRRLRAGAARFHAVVFHSRRLFVPVRRRAAAVAP